MKQKWTILLTFVLSLVMTTSLVFASTVDDRDEHDHSYCETVTFGSIEEMIAHAESTGDLDDILDFVNYLEENDINIELSETLVDSMSACSHSQVYWVYSGGGTKNFPDPPKSSYCYTQTYYDSAFCVYCDYLVKIESTTYYRDHNYPSGGGMCRNGCGMGYVR